MDINEFLELKKTWNNSQESLSKFYRKMEWILYLNRKWDDWTKVDTSRFPFSDESSIPEMRSVIGSVASPAETTNLLACHKRHAIENGALPSCVKAAHSVDIMKQDQLDRYTNFLRVAKITDQHPGNNFLKVEGVFVDDSTSAIQTGKEDEQPTLFTIITEVPCMTLGKLIGRIITDRHIISPPIIDEIVRELLDAVEFLHDKNIVHGFISIDTIVCKTETSLVPIALVDVDYCGSEKNGGYEYCTTSIEMPRPHWLYYYYGKLKSGEITSRRGVHQIAPEVVKNRLIALRNQPNEELYPIGHKADVYQIGTTVWELIANRSPISVYENDCQEHTSREMKQNKDMTYTKAFSTQYDLWNCQKCQANYLTHLGMMDERLQLKGRGQIPYNLESNVYFNYYGPKYADLIRKTLRPLAEERCDAWQLKDIWENQLASDDGSQLIKNTCVRQTFCVSKVDWGDKVKRAWRGELEAIRQTYATNTRLPLVTNALIKCSRAGREPLTEELAELIMTHTFQQVVRDDERSLLHTF